PTANLSIAEDYKLIPKNGAYIVNSSLNGKIVYGMMNIGYNPTVNGTEKSIEINFFDFDADLYNLKIQVNILVRLRDEHKFESIDALKAQLAEDKEKSLQYINQ
ncbi:MAG: riboflavin kinase, partial [Maribacter sp.]